MDWVVTGAYVLVLFGILGPLLLSLLLWRLPARARRPLLALTSALVILICVLDYAIDGSGVNYSAAGEMALIVAWPLLLFLAWWKLGRWLLAKIVLLALPAAWLVYGLFIFLIFAGLPRLNYLQAEHRCGHQPVIVDSFMGSSWYTLPGDSEYGVSFANSAYFCSERAAKEAGYTHH